MSGREARDIKSAHRVLEILEYFDKDRRHATVMDLARTLSYPQSSTSELLRCLTRLGYLHYNRYRRTYSPTARVALLGTWVESSLTRNGPILAAMEEVALATDETVALSTAANYVVQHVHVVHGAADHAIDARVGDALSLLHSAEGRLLLSSYHHDQIRSALHRLNAEEQDPSRRVRLTETVDELLALREKGWFVQHDGQGQGSVAISLRSSRTDRMVMSIIAPSEVIERNGEDMVALLLEKRGEVSAQLSPSEPKSAREDCNIMPFSERAQPQSQHYQRMIQ